MTRILPAVLTAALAACGASGSSPRAGEPSGAEPSPGAAGERDYERVEAASGSCADLSAAAGRVLSLSQGGDHPCASDEDCALGPSGTACSARCPSAVARGRLPAIHEAVAWADARHCAGFDHDRCPYPVPDCPPASPACVSGQCVER